MKGEGNLSLLRCARTVQVLGLLLTCLLLGWSYILWTQSGSVEATHMEAKSYIIDSQGNKKVTRLRRVLTPSH